MHMFVAAIADLVKSEPLTLGPTVSDLEAAKDSPIGGDHTFYTYFVPGAMFQAKDGSTWHLETVNDFGMCRIRNAWYPREEATVPVADIRRSIDSWIMPIQQRVESLEGDGIDMERTAKKASLPEIVAPSFKEPKRMRRFTKTDWYGFSGAERFPDGSEPMIGFVKCTNWPTEFNEIEPTTEVAIVAGGDVVEVIGLGGGFFLKDFKGDAVTVTREAIQFADSIALKPFIGVGDLLRMGMEPVNFDEEAEAYIERMRGQATRREIGGPAEISHLTKYTKDAAAQEDQYCVVGSNGYTFVSQSMSKAEAKKFLAMLDGKGEIVPASEGLQRKREMTSYKG
jgi:hypothetical protein